MKFRKKPVVLEAIEVNAVLRGADGKWPEPPIWLQAAMETHAVQIRIDNRDPAQDSVHILTLEGVMRADRGDWIIQGVKGEIYPCKPDIFVALYEPVTESEAQSA